MAPLSVEELERFVQNALEAKVCQGGGTKIFSNSKEGWGFEVVVGEGCQGRSRSRW